MKQQSYYIGCNPCAPKEKHCHKKHSKKSCKIRVILDNSLDNVAIAKGDFSNAYAEAVENYQSQYVYENKIECKK